MLLRFDPFRELDRMADERVGRAASPMPMDAYRHGNQVVAHIDLPGVGAEDLDIEVERNVLTVSASRSRSLEEGDELIVGERRHGEFRRQIFLGDTLDASRVDADVRDGVLTLRIPVAETAKPRKIQVSSGSGGNTIDVTGSEAEDAEPAVNA